MSERTMVKKISSLATIGFLCLLSVFVFIQTAAALTTPVPTKGGDYIKVQNFTTGDSIHYLNKQARGLANFPIVTVEKTSSETVKYQLLNLRGDLRGAKCDDSNKVSYDRPANAPIYTDTALITNDGDYKICIQLSDTNSSSYAAYAFTVDTAPPTATGVFADSNDITLSNQAQFGVSITDIADANAGGIRNIVYSLDPAGGFTPKNITKSDSNERLSSGDHATTLDVSGIPDGTYALQARIYDNAENFIDLTASDTIEKQVVEKQIVLVKSAINAKLPDTDVPITQQFTKRANATFVSLEFYTNVIQGVENWYFEYDPATYSDLHLIFEEAKQRNSHLVITKADGRTLKISNITVDSEILTGGNQGERIEAQRIVGNQSAAGRAFISVGDVVSLKVVHVGDTVYYLNQAARGLTESPIVTATQKGGVDGIGYSIQSDTAIACDSNLTYTDTPIYTDTDSITDDGDYAICIEASNNSDSVYTKYNFTVDTTPPTATDISAKSNEITTSNQAEFEVSITGIADAKRIVYSLDPAGGFTPKQDIVASGDHTTTLDLSSVLFGTYTLQARVYDKAENFIDLATSNTIGRPNDNSDILPSTLVLVSGRYIETGYNNNINYLNEKATNALLKPAPIVTVEKPANVNSIGYSIQSDTATACDSNLTYTDTPIYNDTDSITNDGDYAICIRASNDSGSVYVKYNFIVDTTPPTATGVSAAEEITPAGLGLGIGANGKRVKSLAEDFEVVIEGIADTNGVGKIVYSFVPASGFIPKDIVEAISGDYTTTLDLSIAPTGINNTLVVSIYDNARNVTQFLNSIVRGPEYIQNSAIIDYDDNDPSTAVKHYINKETREGTPIDIIVAKEVEGYTFQYAASPSSTYEFEYRNTIVTASIKCDSLDSYTENPIKTDSSILLEAQEGLICIRAERDGGFFYTRYPVFVDTTLPSITSFSTSTTEVIKTRDVVFSATTVAVDLESALKEVVYEIYDQNDERVLGPITGEFFLGLNLKEFDLSALRSGTYTIQATVYDYAGNASEVSTTSVVLKSFLQPADFIVNYDNGSEEIHFINKDGKSNTTQAIITIDGIEGFFDIKYNIQSGTAVECSDIALRNYGTNPILVGNSVIDNDGGYTICIRTNHIDANYSYLSYKFIVDTTPPTATGISADSNSITLANQAQFEVTVAGIADINRVGKIVYSIDPANSFTPKEVIEQIVSNRQTTTLDLSGILSGTYTLQASVYDNAGNSSDPIRSINSVTKKSAYTQNPAIIDYDHDDNVLTESRHYISKQVKNSTPPIDIIVAKGAEGFTFQYAASSNVTTPCNSISGYSATAIKSDNGVFDNDGAAQICIREQKGNNFSYEKYTIFTDTTPPTINSFNIPATTIIREKTETFIVSVTASDSGSGVGSVHYEIRNQNNEQVSGSYTSNFFNDNDENTTNLNLSTLEFGTYTIRAIVYDIVGSASEASTANVTLTPPTLTLTLANDTGISKSDGITSDSTITVIKRLGTAWKYSFDGSTYVNGDGTGGTVTIPKSAFPTSVGSNDREYNITVREFDLNGVQLLESTLTIFVDTVSPVQTVIPPIKAGTTRTLSFVVEDSNAIQVNGALSSKTFDAEQIIPAGIPSGEYDTKPIVVVHDAAGNMVKMKIRIDNDAPVINSVSAVNTSRKSRPYFTVNVSGTAGETLTPSFDEKCQDLQTIEGSYETTEELGTYTVTFNSPSSGTYSDCSIQFTDDVENVSADTFAIPSFRIASSGGGGGIVGSITSIIVPDVFDNNDGEGKIIGEDVEQDIVPVGKIIFTTSLQLGDEEKEVKQLQQFLNNQGFTVTDQGAGSPGQETEYFGPATKRALEQYQEVYKEEILTPLGLSAPTGVLGPATIQHIQEQIEQSIPKQSIPKQLIPEEIIIIQPDRGDTAGTITMLRKAINALLERITILRAQKSALSPPQSIVIPENTHFNTNINAPSLPTTPVFINDIVQPAKKQNGVPKKNSQEQQSTTQSTLKEPIHLPTPVTTFYSNGAPSL